MKKIIIQGIIITSVFFGAWFSLTQINWVALFRIQQATDRTEEKLGELLWEVFQRSEDENNTPAIVSSIDSIVTHICTENTLNRENIKVHIVTKDDINAFALPNGHLVVYSGLIINSDNQEELTGVICHEISHIELNHVMKKLISEMGLSVLISMTTGNGGAEIIKETAKILSSTAFDRSLEKEADIKAVDYLIKAKVNPEPFANFLYKLSSKESEASEYLTWINTHPNSKERAEYIIEYSKNKSSSEYKSILSAATWNKLQNKLKERNDDNE